VAVYDWGAHDGTYFIAMEYVPGSTLKEVIARRGARPEEEARAITADVAAALAVAHAHGVVHRDVKPHNVLLDVEGGAKVTDFGIARAIGVPQLTDKGTILGSAHYASPEQIQRRPVDGRSDLYSLGVVLYEALAGRPPFTGENPVAVAWQHVHEAPPPIATCSPGVSPCISSGVERILLKALAKDPAERFQTAAELRAALLDSDASPDPYAAATRATARTVTTLPERNSAEPEGDGELTQVLTPVWQPAAAAAPAVTQTRVLQRAPAPARFSRSRGAIVAFVAGLAALSILGPLFASARDSAMRVATSPLAAPISQVTPQTEVLGVNATAEAAMPPTAPSGLVPTIAPTQRPDVATQLPPVATPPPEPAPGTPEPSPPALEATSPGQAVVSFYQAVAAGQFGGAAALWSPRMRAQYPPGEFITSRFAQTQRIAVNAAGPVSTSGDRATVAVDLVEVIGTPAVTRRWVGTWELVRTPAGWLLDRPQLLPG
jgi:hypothetical protein